MGRCSGQLHTRGTTSASPSATAILSSPGVQSQVTTVSSEAVIRTHACREALPLPQHTHTPHTHPSHTAHQRHTSHTQHTPLIPRTHTTDTHIPHAYTTCTHTPHACTPLSHTTLFIFEFYFIYFLNNRFSVVYFIHISVYMSIPISQFIPPSPTSLSPLGVHTFVLYICLYFCLANSFFCTIFLDSTYMR